MKYTNPTVTNQCFSHVLNVAFDVSSETINFSYQLLDTITDGECLNETESITQTLQQIHKSAAQGGFDELRVICESTGVYHRRLLDIASRLGHRTNLVHGEAVANCRKLQFHDNGKTDVKDPKAILTVARLGQLVQDRQLDQQYAQLRELHRVVMRWEKRRRSAKNELRSELRCLLPDLRSSKDVLFGKAGCALMQLLEHALDKLVEEGFESFHASMRLLAQRTKRSTIEKLWTAIVSGRTTQTSVEVRAILSESIRDLHAEVMDLDLKIKGFERRMQDIYLQLQAEDPQLPKAQKGVMSTRLLARLAAETGPPSDFQTVRQLLRYAGLNLYERQSGKWRGQTKISRKGRSEIRHVLNLMSLPLVSKRGLFADYYRRKKDVDKMPGTKAMTCVMRKVLKMFFGLTKTEEAFDEQRVHSQPSHRKRQPKLSIAS